ncbi:hypothetical protein D3C81_2094530 [compost metagenome]
MVGQKRPQALPRLFVQIDKFINDQFVLHYFIQHIAFRLTKLRAKYTLMRLIIQYTMLPPLLITLERSVVFSGKAAVQALEYIQTG